MRRPDFLKKAAAPVVRAPRWYRPAPSGLNGAPHRAGARRPAAALDPGDLWRATGPAKRAAQGAAPVRQRRPPGRVRPAAGRPYARHQNGGTLEHDSHHRAQADTCSITSDRQKNYKADKPSAAKLSLNQSRGAPAPPGRGPS